MVENPTPQSSKHPPAILVVEDEPVNQLVARAMLERLGFRVRVAGSSREALDASEAERFSLVLMDCDLPDKDGFRTSIELHERAARMQRRPTPVLAVTALDWPDLGARCEAAGMVGHLSKPVTVGRLEAAIRPWLGEADEPGGQAAPGAGPAATEAPAPCLDPAIIRQLHDLAEATGSARVIADLVDTWEKSASHLQARLQSAHAAMDATGLCSAAHALKGSSASMGAHEVARLCADIEQASKAEELGPIAALLPQLPARVERARNALRALCEEGRAPASAAAPDRSNAGSALVVLVVDDEPTNRALVRAALTPAGFKVIEADSGPSGIHLFEEHHPSVILMDVMMEGLDGFDTCAAIRARPAGREIPIIFMTALGDIGSVERAYDVGGSDFIVKPINAPILRKRIQFLLRAWNAMERLQRSESNLAAAQRIAGLGNWAVDLSTGALECSTETLRIMGLPADATPSCQESLRRHVHPEDQARVFQAAQLAISRHQPFSLRYRLRLPSGEERFVQEQTELLEDENGIAVGVMGTLLDVTERTRAEERIFHLAYYDSVTGLANRALLVEALAEAVTVAREKRGKGALLFIDLDRFKRINDTLGHSTGDMLLHCVADRIGQILRKHGGPPRRADGIAGDGPDRSLLARFAGDEFVVLLPEVESEDAAASVADRVLSVLAASFMIGGHEIMVSASVGISIFPDHGEDVDTLLKEADGAMYAAKQSGGNGYHFFRLEESSNHSTDKLVLEADLHRALERQEFDVFYQPKADLRTGQLIGAEALVRWRHPVRGLVSPLDFIPLAEESGLIVPIGRWVLSQACHEMRAWRDQGLELDQIAVNLSTKQFDQPDLCKMVRDILDETGLPAAVLELEITESMVMRSADSAIATMRAIRNLGVSIAIDDFGTGHSSLNYLRKLPANVLKIDRSFVRHVDGPSQEDRAIANAIISLARALGLHTVAEGVERQAQASWLAEAGCDAMQGYLLSPPLPGADFVAFVSNQQRKAS